MKKLIIIVVAVLVLGAGGWLAYDNLFSSTADEEFSLDSSTSPSTTVGSGVPSGDKSDGVAALSGTWVTDAASEAGYRIVEDTPTGEKTVTGRTNTVEGAVTLADGSLTATAVTVDLASVASDQPLRDTAFRDTIMKTSEFPNAAFTQTDAVTLPSGASPTAPITVEVPGTLELRGVSKPATATIDAVSDGTVVTVVGKVEVKLADFDIDPPAIPGLVTVRDAGTIEFKLVLNKG